MIVLRKLLVAVLALTLVFGMGAAAYAADSDAVTQKVRIHAPYYLNEVGDNPGTVQMRFNPDDYANGYVQKNNQLKLQVAGPGQMNVYAYGNSGGKGTINALKVRADEHDWVDLDGSGKIIYSKSNAGNNVFNVDYKVRADDLDPNTNEDIDNDVTVTYALL